MEQDKNETTDTTNQNQEFSTETDIPEAEMNDAGSAPPEESDAEASSNGGKSHFHLNLHFVLIAAILIIACVSVYRLIRWNQGTKLSDDPEEIDTSQFDIEVLDMILPMDASKLEGHEDDGVTTILCLGNNPFSDDRDSTGLAAQIPLQHVNIRFTIRNTPRIILISFM